MSSQGPLYSTLVPLGGLRPIAYLEVIIDPAKVFFDSNTRPHHHLYDVSTGELSDISADEIAFSRLPSLPGNVDVEAVEVVVRVRSRT